MDMETSIDATGKFNLPLAFGSDKCNNDCSRFLVARRVSVVGFMSDGMDICTVSEVFAISPST